MAISRYRNSSVLRGKFSFKLDPKTRKPKELIIFDGQKYTTLSDDALDMINAFEITYKKTDTLMAISQRYYGDPTYWWVIALINNIGSETDLEDGQNISIFSPVELFINEVGL